MKKTRKFLVGMLCALSASFGAFALSACEEDHVHSYTDEVTAPTCTEKGYTTHTCSCGDTVVDTYVDALGHEFTDEVTAPTCTKKGYTTHTCSCGETVVDTYVDELGHEFTEYLSDNNATYDSDGTKTATCNREGCEEKDTVTEENTKLQSRIAFKTLIADGLKVTSEQSFPNSTTEFSFADEIECLGNVSYEVARDKYGESTFLTKVAPLNEGDNTFYVFENAEGKTNVYEITIRRRPMYRVYFYTNGGTAVETQTVEEDDFATMPESVKKLGYDFMGWDYDFSQAITENIGIDAQWEILPEMQNFEFYSTETTCEITGLVDTTVTEVVIPDFVTSIGDSAFYDCKYLTSITIPDSVTSIGGYAFSNSDALSIIYCEAESKHDGWSNYWNSACFPVVWNCNYNDVADDGYIHTVVSGIHYGIKDGVAEVLEQPKNIISANILSLLTYKGVQYSATSICDSAFYKCNKLTNIIIPDSVTSIGAYAFSGCSSLASVVIGNSVTSIEYEVFSYCSSLTSITIPDSVTSIASDAFIYSNKLQYTIQGGLKYLGNPTNPYVYLVKAESNNITTAIIENGCKIIGYDAFYNCYSLTSITIPDSVTFIYAAFSDCNKLQYTIQGGLKYLGNPTNPYVYLVKAESNNITTAIIENGCKIIGGSAFSRCSSLYVLAREKKWHANRRNGLVCERRSSR